MARKTTAKAEPKAKPAPVGVCGMCKFWGPRDTYSSTIRECRAEPKPDTFTPDQAFWYDKTLYTDVKFSCDQFQEKEGK